MPQPRAKAKPAPEDDAFRLLIEGKPYEINQDDLTWGEIEELEIYFDKPVNEVDLDSGRGTMFLAYVARKRVEPDFTLDDMKRIKAVDVKVDDSPRPTDSEDEPAGTPSS